MTNKDFDSAVPREGAEGLPQVVITSAAFESLLAAARSRPDTDLVGALLGVTGSDQAGQDFIAITAVSALGSTSNGVALLANAWNNLKTRLDPKLHVVGWAMADRGLGVFAPRIDEGQLYKALPVDTGLELAINSNSGAGGFFFLRNGINSPATSVTEALSGDENGAGLITWPGVAHVPLANLPAALSTAIAAAESVALPEPVAEAAPKHSPEATLPWPVAAPEANTVAAEPAPVQQPPSPRAGAVNNALFFSPRTLGGEEITNSGSLPADQHVGLTAAELAQLWGPSSATGAHTRLEDPAVQLLTPVSASDADVYGRPPMTLATALADRRVLLGALGVIVLLLLVFGVAILLGGNNTPPEGPATPDASIFGAGSTPTLTSVASPTSGSGGLIGGALSTATATRVAPSSTPLTVASPTTIASPTQAPATQTATSLPATTAPTTASTATVGVATEIATASVTTTAVTTPTTSATTAPATVTGAPANGTIISYTVKPGDTLNSIAAAYNTTVNAIIARNNITNADSLRVGDTLSIKVGEGRAAAATTTPRRTPTSTR